MNCLATSSNEADREAAEAHLDVESPRPIFFLKEQS